MPQNIVPYERLLQMFQDYVANDADAADIDYIREILFDMIGMTEEEAKALGFDYLLPEEGGQA